MKKNIFLIFSVLVSQMVFASEDAAKIVLKSVSQGPQSEACGGVQRTERLTQILYPAGIDVQYFINCETEKQCQSNKRSMETGLRMDYEGKGALLVYMLDKKSVSIEESVVQNPKECIRALREYNGLVRKYRGGSSKEVLTSGVDQALNIAEKSIESNEKQK